MLVTGYWSLRCIWKLFTKSIHLIWITVGGYWLLVAGYWSLLFLWKLFTNPIHQSEMIVVGYWSLHWLQKLWMLLPL